MEIFGTDDCYALPSSNGPLEQKWSHVFAQKKMMERYTKSCTVVMAG